MNLFNYFVYDKTKDAEESCIAFGQIADSEEDCTIEHTAKSLGFDELSWRNGICQSHNGTTVFICFKLIDLEVQ
jgi:hypothetical protein